MQDFEILPGRTKGLYAPIDESSSILRSILSRTVGIVNLLLHRNSELKACVRIQTQC